MDFINRIEIQGVVGAVKTQTYNGVTITNFSVCTNSTSSDGLSFAVETTWFHVTAFGNKCGDLDKLAKGKWVNVKGRVRMQTYTAPDNTERTTFSVLASQIEILNNEWEDKVMASTSDYMKQDIKEYLDKLAERDEAFAFCYMDDTKSLEQCMDFICTQVQKSGAKGFHDNEIYSLAVHYYQEDEPGEIQDGLSKRCNVIINHPVELTEEEKEQAKQKALDEITAKEMRRLEQKAKREKEAAKDYGTPRQSKWEEEEEEE